MKLHRIWGLTLRYLYLFKHSLDRLSDAFFWPTVDIILWGMTSSYFAKNLEGGGSSLILGLLGGIILWIFPWRSQYEIAVNLLEDLWNKNLVNIFVSPVKFMEWVTTLLLLGVGKALISFTYASLLIYLLYSANILSVGLVLVPWAVLLIMFGWVFGLLVAGIIMRYGTKIQTLAWTSIYIIAPFAAVYYPVSSLPIWAQNVASFVPASYVFEAMRAAVSGSPVPLTNLLWPTFLCLIYFVVAMVMIYRSFNHILKRGLISVD
jgi:ABC-2 type transport system permease protein